MAHSIDHHRGGRLGQLYMWHLIFLGLVPNKDYSDESTVPTPGAASVPHSFLLAVLPRREAPSLATTQFPTCSPSAAVRIFPRELAQVQLHVHCCRLSLGSAVWGSGLLLCVPLQHASGVQLWSVQCDGRSDRAAACEPRPELLIKAAHSGFYPRVRAGRGADAVLRELRPQYWVHLSCVRIPLRLPSRCAAEPDQELLVEKSGGRSQLDCLCGVHVDYI
ncbi:unnamed protein product [Sphagnum balticum]